MKTKKIFKIIALFFSVTIYSQIDKPTNVKEELQNKKEEKDSLQTSEDKEKSYFEVKTSYTNNYNFNGRINTTPVPFISPYIGYFNKTGFSISSSLYYSLAQNEQRIEFFLIDAFYDFEINKKLSIGAYANKTTYDKSSNLFSSSIKGYLGGYFDYDFKYFNITVENTLLFSNKTDIAIAPSIYREIDVFDDEKFIIKPTFLANFSSTNFYEDLLQRGGIKNHHNTIDVVTTVDDKKIQIWDYEFSIPVEYNIKDFGIYAIPMVLFPQNPIHTTNTRTVYGVNDIIGQPTTIDSTPAYERNLKTQFIIEFGAYYRF